MASEFLLAFRRLVDLADNNPVGLAERARNDANLQEACKRLSAAETELWLQERYSEVRFSEHIPSHEIQARREFEQRWKREVARTDPIVGSIFEQQTHLHERDPIASNIEDAAENGAWRAGKFQDLIDWAKGYAECADDDSLCELIYSGTSTWDHLISRTQFGLANVLARDELVPFILIPSDISRFYGTAESFSLLERLKDAQRAFVFGCYLASAALQRAILEDVLTRHYGAKGRWLRDKIGSAPMPWGVNRSALHEICTLGNDVLHADRPGKLSSGDLVRKLVEGLAALQALIEGAPTRGSQ